MPTFKLSKADREKIKMAAERTEEPAAALTAAIETYNEALAALRGLVRGIEADWQAAWDKHSERWQEGATGQVVPKPSQRGPLLRTSLKIFRLIFRKSKYPRSIDHLWVFHGCPTEPGRRTFAIGTVRAAAWSSNGSQPVTSWRINGASSW
jgi:hypothetical protein